MNVDKKPSRRSTIIITISAAVFFILAAILMSYLLNARQSALGSVAPILPPVTLDLEAPNLTLVDLQGQQVSLASYLGKVVLVNNWATWCPPCQSEMPDLQAYYSAHVNDGFVLVAIASEDVTSNVTSYAHDQHLSFPVWLDPDGLATAAFKNSDLPSSYVIDRSGTVRLGWTGQVNQPTLEKYLTPLLEMNK